jgi:hypothetical protein
MYTRLTGSFLLSNVYPIISAYALNKASFNGNDEVSILPIENIKKATPGRVAN